MEAFNTITFLCNSYVNAKEEFLTYDFTQFNVREVDMFNMFLNALEAMATNVIEGKHKSCFALKDSEYYDNCIDYVVAKVLRNMIVHHSKPYSEIVYYDDECRHFIVTREDFLELGAPNKSAKEYISNSNHDYYDIVEVIKHALEITDEINVYMFNLIAKKEWHRFISARYTIREYIGVDWQVHILFG